MKGRVLKINSGVYSCLIESGEVVSVKGSGRLRQFRVDKNSTFNKSETLKTKIETKTLKLSPKPGDIVEIENFQIVSVMPRINEFFRPDIANVNQFFLIFSASNPTFSFQLLDRFLCLLNGDSFDIYIVITKIDITPKDELEILKSKLKYYDDIGYKVLYVDSKHNVGLDQIEPLLQDKVSVFTGQTGSGKSTSLNALFPNLNLATQEISEALGRGKHTTRVTELYLYDGGYVADTPGFSSIEFLPMYKDELKGYFKEFEKYQCKYRDCEHINEPGCKVKEAVCNKEILKERYLDYLAFYEEVKNKKRKY